MRDLALSLKMSTGHFLNAPSSIEWDHFSWLLLFKVRKFKKWNTNWKTSR